MPVSELHIELDYLEDETPVATSKSSVLLFPFQLYQASQTLDNITGSKIEREFIVQIDEIELHECKK